MKSTIANLLKGKRKFVLIGLIVAVAAALSVIVSASSSKSRWEELRKTIHCPENLYGLWTITSVSTGEKTNLWVYDGYADTSERRRTDALYKMEQGEEMSDYYGCHIRFSVNGGGSQSVKAMANSESSLIYTTDASPYFHIYLYNPDLNGDQFASAAKRQGISESTYKNIKNYDSNLIYNDWGNHVEEYYSFPVLYYAGDHMEIGMMEKVYDKDVYDRYDPNYSYNVWWGRLRLEDLARVLSNEMGKIDYQYHPTIDGLQGITLKIYEPEWGHVREVLAVFPNGEENYDWGEYEYVRDLGSTYWTPYGIVEGRMQFEDYATGKNMVCEYSIDLTEDVPYVNLKNFQQSTLGLS